MASKEVQDFIKLTELASVISTLLVRGGFQDDGATWQPGTGLAQTHVTGPDGFRYTLTVSQNNDR